MALIPYKQGMWDDIPCGEFYVDHGNGYTEYRKETHPYICEYSKYLTVSELIMKLLILKLNLDPVTLFHLCGEN